MHERADRFAQRIDLGHVALAPPRLQESRPRAAVRRRLSAVDPQRYLLAAAHERQRLEQLVAAPGEIEMLYDGAEARGKERFARVGEPAHRSLVRAEPVGGHR